MRLACSIRYGGEMVKAKDVGYEDYKRLGLVCPECKSPVFLRRESKKASAHFAHFRASDPALVQQCELRVAGYSEKDLERKATQARNQRLKLLQRWFWTIYFSCAFRDGFSKHQLEKSEFYKSLERRYPIDDYVQYFYDYADKGYVELAIQNSILSVNPDILKSPRVKGLLEKVVNSELGLHRLIIIEVVEMLKSNRSLSLLRKLLVYSSWQVEVSPAGRFRLNNGDIYLPVSNLITVFCLIPWAEKFEELDNKNENNKIR